MGNKRKEDRADDTEVKKFNWLGLGLRAIGERLNCTEATISQKLKKMGEKPNDTRRSFMEEVFKTLNNEQQDWLADYLYTNQIPVQTYVAQLIQQAFEIAPKEVVVKVPELPKMTELPEDTSDPFSISTGDEVVDDMMKNLLITGTAVVKVSTEGTTSIPTDSLFED